MRQWRLIYDQPTLGAANGARNMAVDAAILAAVSAGDAPPTLRFYGWMPPCLSLGYGQHAREADADRLAARGWGIVRRPTGGRAILHADELTYSVALPADHPLARISVVESYRRISMALLAALEVLGAHPHADRAAEGANAAPSPVCFETPSHYEITVDGRKLVGSAQVRRREGLLQHGTLPLWGDITRICDVLYYASEAERIAAKDQVRGRAATLADVTGTVIDWQTAAATVAAGFRQTLDLDLTPGELSAREWGEVERFTAEVYGSPDWTDRR